MATLNRPLVILDVETTGFKPEEGHSIVEIAAERVEGQAVTARFETLVNPGHAIAEEAVRIHGITDEAVRGGGKLPAEVFPAFVAFLGEAIIVGHNVQFDLGFLNAHLARLQLPLLRNEFLDTCELARRYLILPSYSLEHVARYLKVPQPSAHRAAADVATTRQVLFQLIARAKGRRA